MSTNLKELINKLYVQNLEKEQLASRQNEISLKMLSTQINPHFLFNTLETIRMKVIASGEKEVALMLKLLASLLRYNLSVKGQPGPLIDELNAVQNYLTIQHMRFGDRVSYDVMTMCDITNIKILPFLIQPIVENSFSHGLEDKVSGGFIYIIVNMENNEENAQNILAIEVKDNGCGIPEDKLADLNEKLTCSKPEDYSSSIGLINVQSRIKLFYGQEYGISITSRLGEGTSVQIRIPVL
jgi:two-component system sensor histidine kinase YesM